MKRGVLGVGGVSVIDIVNLHKYFQELHVLKGIHLHVKEGEVVVIIGGNNSGKSTLLRCLHGLEQPDEGDIWIQHVTQAESSIKIGAVYQHVNLFPHKTVMENIMGTLMVMNKQTKNEAILEGNTLLNKVGMEDKAYVYPQKLSNGQKRCVAIAQALAMKPRILLFDNPTVGLNGFSSTQIIQTIKGLISTGLTIVIGTDEIKVAQELGERVVFLKDGVILEENTNKTFFEQPQSDAARQYIQKWYKRK